MEFLTNLFNTALPLLTLHGSGIIVTVFAMFGIVLAIGLLILLSKLITPASNYLEALAEKHLSSKIGGRVANALNNLEGVLIDLINTEREMIIKMGKEAYQNDNQIDVDELKAIAEKVGKVALERITPDVNTLKKYIAGDAIYDWVVGKATSIVTEAVGRVIENNLSK